MATSLIGLVYYRDDPERLVFRKVFPEKDDRELDDPQWVTLCLNPAREAVMVRVPADGGVVVQDGRAFSIDTPFDGVP